jgi:hypothetical protein
MSNETQAHAFWRDHVLPALEDWRADETAVHKAMLIATNLTHMAEYFWESFSGQPERVFGRRAFREFRSKLEEEFPDYAIIRDVCDAHKHLKLMRSSKRVTHSSQTSSGRMGWGEAKFGEGRWGSPEEIVVIDDGGGKHHFIALVKRTEEMWQKLLK